MREKKEVLKYCSATENDRDEQYLVLRMWSCGLRHKDKREQQHEQCRAGEEMQMRVDESATEGG
jgi:hypothetical protein